MPSNIKSFDQLQFDDATMSLGCKFTATKKSHSVRLRFKPEFHVVYCALRLLAEKGTMEGRTLCSLLRTSYNLRCTTNTLLTALNKFETELQKRYYNLKDTSPGSTQRKEDLNNLKTNDPICTYESDQKRRPNIQLLVSLRSMLVGTSSPSAVSDGDATADTLYTLGNPPFEQHKIVILRATDDQHISPTPPPIHDRHRNNALAEQYIHSISAYLDQPTAWLQPHHKGWLRTPLNLSRQFSALNREHTLSESSTQFREAQRAHPHDHLLYSISRGSDPARVCIVGYAHSGKTTFLRTIADYTLHASPDSSTASPAIPVLISLPRSHDTAPVDLMERIVAHVARWFPNTSIEVLRSWVQDVAAAGQLVILIDDLDRITPSIRRHQILQDIAQQASISTFANCSLVLACSPWVLDSEAPLFLQYYEFRPLHQKDIRHCITRYFEHDPSNASRVLARFMHGIWRTITNQSVPAYVHLFCSLAHQQADGSAVTVEELYERVCSHMARRISSQLSTGGSMDGASGHALLKITSLLAWYCWNDEQGILFRDSAHQYIDELHQREPTLFADVDAASPDRVLETIVTYSGLLEEDNSGLLRFTDSRIMQYLAGRHLASCDDSVHLQAFEEHAWDPAWEPVFVHMMYRLWIGTDQSRQLAHNIIKWLLFSHYNGSDDTFCSLLCLAGRLIATRSPAVREEEGLTKECTQLLLQSMFDIARYGGTDQQLRLRDTLVILARFEEDLIVDTLSQNLSQTLDPMLAYTFYALQHTVNSLRILGFIGTPRAARILFDYLHSDSMWHSQLTDVCIEALGSIGGSEIVEPLTRMLIQDVQYDKLDKYPLMWPPTTYHRDEALVKALSRCDTGVLFHHLEYALGHSSSSLRGVAVFCLGQARAVEAMEPIANIMESDPEAAVRLLAIDALGDMDAAPACRSILQSTLHAHDDPVWNESCPFGKPA